MLVSAALLVCLTLAIPAAGIDVRGADSQRVVASPTQPSEPTPQAGALDSRQDGFQAFAVEDDLKISPKKRAAAQPVAPSAAVPADSVSVDPAPDSVAPVAQGAAVEHVRSRPPGCRRLPARVSTRRKRFN